jgi:hypothetical protein
MWTLSWSNWVVIPNQSKFQPMVILKHFGPNNVEMPEVAE